MLEQLLLLAIAVCIVLTLILLLLIHLTTPHYPQAGQAPVIAHDHWGRQRERYETQRGMGSSVFWLSLIAFFIFSWVALSSNG